MQQEPQKEKPADRPDEERQKKRPDCIHIELPLLVEVDAHAGRKPSFSSPAKMFAERVKAPSAWRKSKFRPLLFNLPSTRVGRLKRQVPPPANAAARR